MTTHPPLGQRLREWREAHGLTADDVAQRLGYHALTVEWAERQPRLGGDLRIAIEALIAPPAPDTEQIIAGAEAAIRAALAAGYTSVRIIRPETPTSGRLTVLLGEDNDPEWRKWI